MYWRIHPLSGQPQRAAVPGPGPRMLGPSRVKTLYEHRPSTGLSEIAKVFLNTTKFQSPAELSPRRHNGGSAPELKLHFA